MRGSGMSRRRGRSGQPLDFYARYATTIHINDSKTEAVLLKAFAAARNEPEAAEHVAAYCLIGRIFREHDVVLGLEVAHINRRVEDELAGGKNQRALFDVKLVKIGRASCRESSE